MREFFFDGLFYFCKLRLEVVFGGYVGVRGRRREERLRVLYCYCGE